MFLKSYYQGIIYEKEAKVLNQSPIMPQIRMSKAGIKLSEQTIIVK